MTEAAVLDEENLRFITINDHTAVRPSVISKEMAVDHAVLSVLHLLPHTPPDVLGNGSALLLR